MPMSSPSRFGTPLTSAAKQMRPNRAKQILAGGGLVVGTMVFEFATTGIARIASAAEADFIVIDTEHSGWTGESLRSVLATGGSIETAQFVRVPTLEYHAVAQALDLGAMGIMAPNVASADEARRLVAFARYPPAGIRGAAFGLARDDYRKVTDLRGRMDEADRETLLIALVESVDGLEDLDAIASVEGIDVVWLGQFDLTLSMGIPGDFEHPRYRAALDAFVGACRSHGKAAGFMATTPSEGRLAVEAGFRCVAYSFDVRIYGNALAEGIAQVRAAATGQGARQA